MVFRSTLGVIKVFFSVLIKDFFCKCCVGLFLWFSNKFLPTLLCCFVESVNMAGHLKITMLVMFDAIHQT